MRATAGRLARVAAVVAVLAAPGFAADRSEQPVSGFAANVGTRDPAAESSGAVTLYVVPDGKTFLLTDILVANHGVEPGPLYLADSQRTRCSVQLLQPALLPTNASAFNIYTNVHTTFSTGIPFGPGEPVIATLAGGMRGVDVTVTGKLVPGPRGPGAIRFRGGARDDEPPPPPDAGH